MASDVKSDPLPIALIVLHIEYIASFKVELRHVRMEQGRWHLYHQSLHNCALDIPYPFENSRNAII